MKISKIYCNRPAVFTPINFNMGLNVIYAKVTKPKDSARDSHNLGKTLLIHLIDFLLLKSLERDHFLYDNREIFKDFVFYLELYTNSGSYVTIRRSVQQSTKICFRTHTTGQKDYSEQPTDTWSKANLPLESARDYLNTLLGLSAIAPWDYRKGTGYFLRTQNDYRDVFQLARFSVGRHKEWKPFMARLLGFEPSIIIEKYKLEDLIAEKNLLRERSRDVTSVDTDEYDTIKGTLQVKKDDLANAHADIERFDFHRQDLQYNTQLVDEVEVAITDLNQRLYTIDYQLSKLRDALARRITFDLDAVSRIFAEAQAVFPDSLRRSYEELLDFNRKISTDRGNRLSEQADQLVVERERVITQLRDFSRQRSQLLSIIQDTDTLHKYRALQHTLVSKEAEVARLETELQQLDKVAQIDKQIRQLEEKRARIIDAIRILVNNGNKVYFQIREEFNRVVREILSVPAIISIVPNQQGNLDFAARILHSENVPTATSMDKGTSYRRLLCCAFDVALLYTHRQDEFYRFVYHDGVFEGLDNRKKCNLLAVIRELCSKAQMQYILTVIDADLPRDPNDKPLHFSPSEIILELNDASQQGRLFRMPKF